MYSYSSYMKKSILIFTLITTFLPIFISSSFLSESQRYLQTQNYVKFSDSGIFYKIEFPKNDITGTGDILQDSPYRALCIVKRCPNLCCTGEIDSMICGTKDQCKSFYDNSIIPNVVAAVIFPLFFISVFILFYCFFYKKSNKKRLSLLLAFCCIFIITIPIVLYLIWKYKLFDLCGGCKECIEVDNNKQ